MTAPTRIHIPQTRVATQASEFTARVSGMPAAAYSFGAQDFLQNATNSVSITNATNSFDQFTLSAADSQPVFVAGLTAGEFAVLSEQGATFRWAYSNTLNVNDGVVIQAGAIVREGLLAEAATNELLFSGATDWERNEQIQELRTGRAFSQYDLLVVFYVTSAVATTSKRDWTILRLETAPLIAGGFDNDIFESVSDNQFRLNSSNIQSGLNADPQTSGIEIWGV